MQYLTTNEIRKIWLDFWQDKDHLILESKSLIPYNDDSLLFINSGVATLKNYLSGIEIPPSKRIVNSQKSLRTNDIENVGVTSRHHTLFEMLGNFSIGDYFKKEAIEYAWELITSDKYFALDIDKIYITVHPKDEESLKYWLALGVSESKIVKTYENFWEIGKGPGGPNTEIFFDRGEKYDKRDPYDLLLEDLETDRVVEIWNIVFSQYNCDPDIPQEQYEELPQKNIDTGMGLERMACIIQEVETNFETDNFKIIMDEISNITNTKYANNKKAYRIIADHIRALTFAISDGADPSNEGRGYVLRRILRRAVKYAYIDLDLQTPFLYKLVDSVLKQMEDYYPYLNEKKNDVKEVVKREEEKFLQTITEGFKHYDLYVKEIKGDTFPADQAFKLYDTYGFPFELTKELLEEQNLKVDEKEYEEHLEEQRQRARDARKDVSTIQVQNSFLSNISLESEFIGYTDLTSNSKVILITDGDQELNELKAGEKGFILLDKTPFYATSGGQEKDQGGSSAFDVINVMKLAGGQHLHEVLAKETITKDMQVEVSVDQSIRKSIQRNHSATHLLHFALNEVLGDSVEQAGSYQDQYKTRFDFTCRKEISKEQLQEVQNIVNEEISKKEETTIEVLDINSAKEKGAKALFGEKYGDLVRVVEVGNSIELCGGTHVENTSDIGKFYIKSEQSIGSGIHRIEAITGDNVDAYKEEVLSELNSEINLKEEAISSKKLVKLDDVYKKYEILENLKQVDATIDLSKFKTIIEKLESENKNLKAELDSESSNKITSLVEDLLTKVKVDDTNKIDEEVEGISNKDLKTVSDLLLDKLQSGVVILRLKEGNKLSIVIKVSEDQTTKYHAGNMIKEILEPLGGRGGGKPTMAQGGATI